MISELGFDIPVDWKVLNLVDVASEEKKSIISGPFGSSISSKYFIDEGVPVIRGNNLSVDIKKFNDEGFVFISREKAEELKAWALPGDIVFTAAGTLGQINIIPANPRFPEYIISNKQLRVRLNQKFIVPMFAYYWLKNKPMVSHIINQNTGSTVPLINLTILKKLPIALPSINEQKHIVEILESLDKKIELNNSINKNLEELAQALFKRWFVDFEFPNESGETYKSSGGELGESELGLIPKGWRVDKIENCTKLVSRGIAPKYDDNSDKLVINQKCIRDGLLNKSLARRHKTKVSDEKHVQFGDILVNSTGVGTLGRVTQVYEQLINYTVDSHVTIIRPNLKNGLGYLGCLLKGMQHNFEHASTGTTGQTELSREVIKQMKIVIPENEIVKRFSDIYHSLFEQIIMNQEENSRLIEIRDSLLPKLVSGEIRVPINEKYLHSQIFDLPLAVENKAHYSTT